MQAYFYQPITVTATRNYRITFSYAANASVAPGTQIFAGLSAIAGIEAQTAVGSLPNASFDSFTVGPNDSGERAIVVTAASAQDAIFLTTILTGGGEIDFDDISCRELTGSLGIEGVRLDNITAALGQAYEVVYYSNRFFTDETGQTWKEIPTTDSDLIQLEGTSAINAFVYAFMLTLQQELKGKDMAADYAFFKAELDGRFGTRGVQLTKGLYELLQDKYPSQAIIRQIDYYNFGPLDGNGG